MGAFGVAAGFVIALFLSRWIRSLLVETRIVDPLTYVGITIIFCVIVAFASWLPARRAASVDPMRALRSE